MLKNTIYNCAGSMYYGDKKGFEVNTMTNTMMNKEKTVYMDNAATTKVMDEVMDNIIPLYRKDFGNPSSIHKIGRNAKSCLENARREIAACLNVRNSTINFTSGGTESDNWAVKSAARLMKAEGKSHIITTDIEHPAILKSLSTLEKEGFSVTYLNCDDGVLSPKLFEAALREDTGFATVMYANNEIGTVQPIAELAEICRCRGIIFHTDAVQAVGHIPVDLESLGADLLSFSGHKFYAPKGAGGLYIREGLDFPRFIDGGEQEHRHRGGTENLPGIAGLAAALKLCCGNMTEEIGRITDLRNRLTAGLLNIKGSRLNGSAEKRLPGNVNVSFDGIEGESLLIMLDMRGICASSGSACSSGSLDASHVLTAIGLPTEMAKGSLRLTLGRYNTAQEVDYTVEAVTDIVGKLREMRM